MFQQILLLLLQQLIVLLLVLVALRLRIPLKMVSADATLLVSLNRVMAPAKLILTHAQVSMLLHWLHVLLSVRAAPGFLVLPNALVLTVTRKTLILRPARSPLPAHSPSR